jgi:DNA-binding FadR family transcriptional regulator
MVERGDEVRVTNLRFQRLAELVADRLRERILRGDLEDGDLLPKEEELRAEYPVSKPSLREAMRILEAEGLITVRRGNVGGAVVHRPTPANVAYTLAMVLSANRVDITDVARALREVEPSCAALCAGRPDRAKSVIPKLRSLQKEAMANVDDLMAATSLSRRFHESLVSLCGNETLIIMVGALEALWSSHETGWASRTSSPARVPVEERRVALDAHQQIIDLIAAGEAASVRDLVAEHLAEVQQYPSVPPGSATIDPVVVRDRLM